ncbi:hypothetical protein [Gemmatimonas phototrophica]|uniref:Uncharacterized protein n=1 Tax=Gemmatimonas phototrophica TaxID=1379270 RepID=A0A143BGX6_9BACT|nr:hypothetical protein [Gemmatimonas phototrophica]AMW03853.1 hypothetical protein GEMMAAP_01340 [Gemmatimonas phototrophica]
MNLLALALLSAGLDCWAPTVVQTASSLSAAERTGVAPLTHTLDRAEQLLRGNTHINALSGVRARLHRFIGHPASPGAPLMADASVWLHRREELWGPQCTLRSGADYTSHAMLSAHVNQLDALFGLLENPQEVTERGTFPPPVVTDSVQGHPIYAGRVLLLTREGVPPLVPVPGDSTRWRVNPALFAGSRRGEVRVIALSLVVNNDDDPQLPAMTQWLTGMDLRPWRALITP